MTKERGTAGRSSNASFGSSRIGIRTDRHSSACAVAAGGRGSISASPRIRPRIYLRTLCINNHFGAGCTGAAIHAQSAPTRRGGHDGGWGRLGA